MGKLKTTVIGTGKLSKAIVKGLICAGDDPESILVIGRSSDPKQHFENLGVSYCQNIDDGFDTEYLFLAITPGGAGSVLKQLRRLMFEQKARFRILISLVSGLFEDRIYQSLEISSSSLIIATTNTNIAYNTGIICVLDTVADDKTLEFLERLGSVTVEHRKHLLLLAIVLVGSMNAFDAKAIRLAYASCKDNIDLHLWLTELLELIQGGKTGLRNSHKAMLGYLDSKVLSLQNFYCHEVSVEKSTLALVSTLTTLLKMGSSVNGDSIDGLIKTVVTKGGCTEQGIDRIDSLSVLSNPEILSDIFKVVHARACRFAEDVEATFN